MKIWFVRATTFLAVVRSPHKTGAIETAVRNYRCDYKIISVEEINVDDIEIPRQFDDDVDLILIKEEN